MRASLPERRAMGNPLRAVGSAEERKPDCWEDAGESFPLEGSPRALYSKGFSMRHALLWSAPPFLRPLPGSILRQIVDRGSGTRAEAHSHGSSPMGNPRAMSRHGRADAWEGEAAGKRPLIFCKSQGALVPRFLWIAHADATCGRH